MITGIDYISYCKLYGSYSLMQGMCTVDNMVLADVALASMYLTYIIVFIVVVVNHCRFMLELVGTVSNSCFLLIGYTVPIHSEQFKVILEGSLE